MGFLKKVSLVLALIMSISTSAMAFTPDAEPLIHVVEQGEDLWMLQSKYGVAFEYIARANDIENGNELEAGAELIIPQDRVTSYVLGEATDDAYTIGEERFTEEDVLVPSTTREGVMIPARVTIPEGEGPFPAIILNHGHGGSLDSPELVAKALGNAGIASIRMSFAGTGTSEDTWLNQNMKTMMADSNDCCDYLVNNYNVDAERLAIGGHSMGGRVSACIIGTGTSPYKVAILVAPFAGEGEFWTQNGTGAAEGMQEAINYATAYGYWTAAAWNFNNPNWKYSPEWFYYLYMSNPGEILHNYTGDIMILMGGEDIAVPPATCRMLLNSCTNASDVQGVHIDIADHGMGMSGTPGNVSETCVTEIVNYLTANL
ncbi:MAG: prolyl oligopeptidase family serine peptidase [Clostridia bacterium]|nr:prolyl oligopeptidase family serine peptidase [Clostridia bacterium]